MLITKNLVVSPAQDPETLSRSSRRRVEVCKIACRVDRVREDRYPPVSPCAVCAACTPFFRSLVQRQRFILVVWQKIRPSLLRKLNIQTNNVPIEQSISDEPPFFSISLARVRTVPPRYLLLVARRFPAKTREQACCGRVILIVTRPSLNSSNNDRFIKLH